MLDVIIRGGTIVDGTGAAAFEGDVAIDGDKIAQVGGKAGPGRREHLRPALRRGNDQRPPDPLRRPRDQHP